MKYQLEFTNAAGCSSFQPTSNIYFLLGFLGEIKL